LSFNVRGILLLFPPGVACERAATPLPRWDHPAKIHPCRFRVGDLRPGRRSGCEPNARIAPSPDPATGSEVPQELIRTALDLELADGTVIADTVGDKPCVFLAGLYRAERGIAERLLQLGTGKLPWPRIDRAAGCEGLARPRNGYNSAGL